MALSVWCRGIYKVSVLFDCYTHLYEDILYCAQVFLVSVEKTQCWNSRHADIDFLCFQPIARYNFLSGEAEDQFDTLTES